MELDRTQLQNGRPTGRVANTVTPKPNVKSIPPRRRRDAYADGGISYCWHSAIGCWLGLRPHLT